MAEKTDWYRYTDETGATWRIKTTGELAAIGGLLPVDFHELRALPKRIKPRYVWLIVCRHARRSSSKPTGLISY
jgi:hypothetical protein